MLSQIVSAIHHYNMKDVERLLVQMFVQLYY